MQYPVSSGQQHRANESEWVPVAPPQKKTEPPAPVPPPPKKSTVPSQPAKEWVLNNWPNPIQPSPLPPQPPLPVPPVGNLNAISIPPVGTSSFHSTSSPIDPLTIPQGNQVFPDTSAASGLDIANIISQRLNAMRKLQDNPNDYEAMSLMNNAQKDVSRIYKTLRTLNVENDKV